MNSVIHLYRQSLVCGIVPETCSNPTAGVSGVLVVLYCSSSGICKTACPHCKMYNPVQKPIDKATCRTLPRPLFSETTNRLQLPTRRIWNVFRDVPCAVNNDQKWSGQRESDCLIESEHCGRLSSPRPRCLAMLILERLA